MILLTFIISCSSETNFSCLFIYVFNLDHYGAHQDLVLIIPYCDNIYSCPFFIHSAWRVNSLGSTVYVSGILKSLESYIGSCRGLITTSYNFCRWRNHHLKFCPLHYDQPSRFLLDVLFGGNYHVTTCSLVLVTTFVDYGV